MFINAFYFVLSSKHSVYIISPRRNHHPHSQNHKAKSLPVHILPEDSGYTDHLVKTGTWSSVSLSLRLVKSK